MNKIDFSNQGGFPLNPEDFEYILENDRGIYETINKVLSGFDDQNFILKGCEIDGDLVSGGTIYMDGEILDIDSFDISTQGTYIEKQTNFDGNGVKEFEDGLTLNVYKYDKAYPTTTNTGVNITQLSTFVDIINGKRNFIKNGDVTATTSSSTIIDTLTVSADATPNRYQTLLYSFMMRGTNIGGGIQISIIMDKNNNEQLLSEIIDVPQNENVNYCRNIPIFSKIQPGDFFQLRVRHTGTYGALIYDRHISIC